MSLPSTGIQYDLSLEHMLVAVWANYTQEGFEALPTHKQARLIAAYRINGLAEAVAAFKRR